MNHSIDANLGLRYISGLRLWHVEEVENPVVRHNSQATVFLIECDYLGLLLNFYFGKTQLGVKEVRYNFHERQPAQIKC